MTVMTNNSAGQDTEITGSDPDAYRQLVREILARLLLFAGLDTPGVLRNVIESVRELVEPGYTIGDAQVDQQIVAGRDADDRVEKAVVLVEHRDRALLLTSCHPMSGDVWRNLRRRGPVSSKDMGLKLHLSNDDVEHIVLLSARAQGIEPRLRKLSESDSTS